MSPDCSTGKAMEHLPIISVRCLAPIMEQLVASRAEDRPLTVSRDAVAEWVNGPLRSDILSAAHHVYEACREVGFMYLSDYNIPEDLEVSLDTDARDFFRRPLDEKMEIQMSRGGLAWRGFFPVGGELTSGKPDIKEGLYFGQERSAADPRVQRKTPLFGSNLFPRAPASLCAQVTEYMTHCEALGQGVLMLVALSLQLPADYFLTAFCADPTCLFRIFHYPPPVTLSDAALQEPSLWGVGEHTDYGLLTLLKQDCVGGLEAQRVDGVWIQAPPVPHTLVVNIGDMMEAMTCGLFISTPHRVRNRGGPEAMRLSFPFFMDPGFHSDIHVLPLTEAQQAEAQSSIERRSEAKRKRWDNGGVTVAVSGTYGAYLIGKVGKVFPELAQSTSVVV